MAHDLLPHFLPGLIPLHLLASPLTPPFFFPEFSCFGCPTNTCYLATPFLDLVGSYVKILVPCWNASRRCNLIRGSTSLQVSFESLKLAAFPLSLSHGYGSMYGLSASCSYYHACCLLTLPCHYGF